MEARKALAAAIADDAGDGIREVTRDGCMYVPMHAHVATAWR